MPHASSVHVSFRLRTSFASFTDEKLRQFIADLANTLDCDKAEIEFIRKQRGCVVLHLNVSRRVAAVLTELLSGDVEHDDLDLSRARYQKLKTKWNVEDFTNYKNIMQIVIKEKPKKPVIIFVHGWSGNEDTFGIMPKYFKERRDVPADIFQYPTGKLSHSPSVHLVADNLHSRIHTKYKNFRIALVGHSQGGIVTRKFVIEASEKKTRYDLNVANLVFIASPHDGTILADLGSKLPIVSSQQLLELGTNSPALYDINKRWARWKDTYIPDSCRMLTMLGTADKVVPLNSASSNDPDAIPILGKGHIEIVKPESEEDDVIVNLDNFLEETGFFSTNET